MPSVNVDIDLDEFDFDDLIQEVIFRVKKSNSSNKTINALLVELKDALTEKGIGTSIDDTLINQMKKEHFFEVINKYSLQQIETALPKY